MGVEEWGDVQFTRNGDSRWMFKSALLEAFNRPGSVFRVIIVEMAKSRTPDRITSQGTFDFFTG